MNDSSWKDFFQICSQTLGKGSQSEYLSESWCSWTTYSRLGLDAQYWASGIPSMDDIADTHIKDGSVWGQPFAYDEIAHVIIPKQFFWEKRSDGDYESGIKSQNIEQLSLELQNADIEHRLTDLMLEVKCY